MGYLVVHNVVLTLQVFDRIVVDGLFFGILYLVKLIAPVTDYHGLVFVEVLPLPWLSLWLGLKIPF